jgi:hypothetical protein
MHSVGLPPAAAVGSVGRADHSGAILADQCKAFGRHIEPIEPGTYRHLPCAL